MSRTYLEPLAWLRGFAAFFVLFSHAMRTAESQYLPADEPASFLWANMLDLGEFAVYLFFALSGCTLYLCHRADFHSGRDVLAFCLRRFMRLWPPFMLSMAVFIAFIAILPLIYAGPSDAWAVAVLGSCSPADALRYVTMIFDVTGPDGCFNAVYWSLPIEFHYYLLLPLVTLLMRGRLSEVAVPALLGTTFFVIAVQWPALADDDRLFRMAFAFLGGMMLAALRPRVAGRLPGWLGVLLFLMLLLAQGLMVNDLWLMPVVTEHVAGSEFFGLSALACVALALFSRTPALPGALRHWLAAGGEVSYSLYLFHMLFAALAAVVIVRLQIHGYVPRLLLTLVIMLPLSYVLAGLTYRHVERPSIRLGRRFAARLIAA